MTSIFLSEFKQFLFSTQNISNYKQLSGKSALTVYNEDRSIVVFVTHDTKGKVQIILKLFNGLLKVTKLQQHISISVGLWYDFFGSSSSLIYLVWHAYVWHSERQS